MRKDAVFLPWLAARKGAVAAGLLCAGAALLLFWLYDLPGEAVGYLLLLCLAVTGLFGVASFLSFRRKDRSLRKVEEEILVTRENLPQAADRLEEDYLSLIHRLAEENHRLQTRLDSALADLTDYYTLWVHQIKTPIAAMDLLLQSGPGKETELEIELQKISQYVDMVLQYLRLDSEAKDLVLRRCDLDEILRQTVRKYAKLFILKKIRLTFHESHLEVLSDEKWLCFLLEQLFSNALKYTPVGGEITIDLAEDETLVIADTGIGIAPEDLPRVFDKGFTGRNGRLDKKATGIGLYLCRRVAGLLGHTIAITSRQGEGTQVYIGLGRPQFDIE